ncbi:major facilitator superfamily transporter [Diplodia corticola]|uniref:Major facilitator superfamily transporter n=1 Tax=Diplodia corticola TaxID=236234 RepID=A0A1J9QN69_9PEZI|nr:major facilitator superfamily transporter [Diplodia corticola]OJD30342.1 major facilitator superfamily transporter [Diplodia corticola]
MATPENKEITEIIAGSDSKEESVGDVEIQGDYGSGREHIFSDPKVADYWRDVYEKAHYEGRHRFDPNFTWSAQEELKLKRKVDWRIMAWCWLMFVALDLNRRNINRAISDNMLADLNMDTNDYNYGQTIFLVSFLAAELPSGLVSKKLGPDVWIPFIITAWSIISAAQAGLKNKTGYYVCRCLIGLLMGGFIPDTVLYITYWYKSKELPIRLSWFWTVLSTCNIVGSLMAAGILQMRGLQGWAGWQWLFLIEGCITTAIGIASWALMPPGPCQTAGRWRGKGWFSEREEKILVNRILRDDPSKGDMHNRQGVDLTRLWKCIKDYDLWPLYLVGLTTYIPPNPPSNYLSFILRQMGFSTFQSNLLTIPSQFMFGVNLLIISRLSEWFNERALVASISNIWIFPWLVALVALGGSASQWVRYALLTGLLSYPYCHAIIVAWNSRNSNTVRTRAVSAALYNMFVQAGNIVGSNIYREDDRPLYQRGNKILLGICSFNVVLFVVVKYYYIRKNKRREEAWAKLTGEEKIDYIHNTKDEGAKRLDFRFAH